MLTKKRIVIISLILIVIGGYFGYQGLTGENSGPQYATAAVERGALVVSVSGSGQVSSSDQIDIKSKVSGDALALGVKNSQKVNKGDLLVQIDASEARKAVENAQTALETARLELEEMLSPADELSLLKAENSVLQAKNYLEKLKLEQETDYQDALDAIDEAEENITEGYENAYDKVSDAFFDLPGVMAGLEDMLYGNDISGASGVWNASYLINSIEYSRQHQFENFVDKATDDYEAVREEYDQNFVDYRDASRYGEPAVIEALLEETIETAKSISEAAKSQMDMLDFWADSQSQDKQVKSKVAECQSALKSDISKINNYISNLSSVQKSFQNNREAKLKAERDLSQMEKVQPLDLAAAEISLEEKEKSLAELKAGPDELEIRAKKNNLQQKQDALSGAQENLAGCSVRAPFDGLVAELFIKSGDSISSGAKLLTIISEQKIAEIALNEIDAAKVKIGQKANISFDAVDGLNITGETAEIDALGTVTQGVVTYNVKIAFDIQDERVKPGMTLSASIITDIRQDALMVSNSAIKQQGDTFYVELVDKAALDYSAVAANISAAISVSDLKNQPIQTGISNDTMTEVLGGLEQGDIVVTQTINSDASASQSSQSRQNSGFNNSGMMRMMR